jgi:hypothetical protein
VQKAIVPTELIPEILLLQRHISWRYELSRKIAGTFSDATITKHITAHGFCFHR